MLADNVQRTAPFRPKLAERDQSRFETRSTQQDAFMPFPDSVRPPMPFIPKEADRTNTRFDHTSTSRAAYIEHPYIPYLKAKKPTAAMAGNGMC